VTLYLVRHADAKREEKDPLRPLSESGVRDIKVVASYVFRMGIKADRIFHSGKLRARQTAEILGESLRPSMGISESEGLNPLDDPRIWAERLKGITEDTIIALVGHLPHLSKLASLLLCGDMNKNFIAFKSAGMVYLEKEGNETWLLRWMLIPEIVTH
jgi:phosphohistidine phosphatase